MKTTSSGKITECLYDNAGNRFIKKDSSGFTLYLRHGQTAVAMDIEVPVNVTDIKGKINRYVLSDELLAGRITKTVKSDGSVTYETSYYHLDHLNSTKCVSDSNGKVAVRYIYRAFGSQLAEISDGEAKYTYGGKELDDTNLYYFGARYYDAEVGRFISEDPAQDGWNWYLYCNDNPLKFKDSTGLKDSEGLEGLNAVELNRYFYAHTFTAKEEGLAKTGMYLSMGFEVVKNAVMSKYDQFGLSGIAAGQNKDSGMSKMIGPIGDVVAKKGYIFTQETIVYGVFNKNNELETMIVKTDWSYRSNNEMDKLLGFSTDELERSSTVFFNRVDGGYSDNQGEIFYRDSDDLNFDLKVTYENPLYENQATKKN